MPRRRAARRSGNYARANGTRTSRSILANREMLVTALMLMGVWGLLTAMAFAKSRGWW